jgi:hypothetical protein
MTESFSFHKVLRQVLCEKLSFQQLLDASKNRKDGDTGRVDRSGNVKSIVPMRIVTIDDNIASTFNYKSSPSTTGTRHHGYIQFFKEDVADLAGENEIDLPCIVDCDCPDYKYRFAYNNAKEGAGRTGRHPDWKYGNDNNGQAPKSREDGGVGDYGIGLCKHLIALANYLRLEYTKDTPDPKDTKPLPPPEKEPEKDTKVQPLTPETPPTSNAPTPDDGKTGSLQEIYGNNKFRSFISNFARTRPVFDISYYDDPVENLHEDYHHLHKDYRLYEGDTHITAIFEDNSRLSFEVHYHNNHGEDKIKWRKKAFTIWKSVANELHGDVQLSEVGNPIQKSWKNCFKEALKHPKLQEYIRQSYHRRVFDNDEVAPCMDSVNFTRMG